MNFDKPIAMVVDDLLVNRRILGAILLKVRLPAGRNLHAISFQSSMIKALKTSHNNMMQDWAHDAKKRVSALFPALPFSLLLATQLGFEIVEACDGLQALEKLALTKRPLSCLFLDLNMVRTSDNT